MIEFKIDEHKLSLSKIIENKGTSDHIVKLGDQLLNQISKRLKEGRQSFSFATNINGLTGYCSTSKAFIYIDYRQSYLSTKYYMNGKPIPGLINAVWGNEDKDSMKGSAVFRIENQSDVDKAVEYACQAYDRRETN